jgi:hypothetical protein
MVRSTSFQSSRATTSSVRAFLVHPENINNPAPNAHAAIHPKPQLTRHQPPPSVSGSRRVRACVRSPGFYPAEASTVPYPPTHPLGCCPDPGPGPSEGMWRWDLGDCEPGDRV